MAPTTPRHLVAARIAERARQFPQLFPQRLRTGGLAGRDAALAHAIDQAVARRWLTLTAVLQSQLSRPWDHLQPVVQSALLVGAAQLLLLERLPDHAVINESVEWAKRKSRKAT
ncbi:MAG: transcription antitermination protein NusB, partial [Planctomycetota bacterium]